MATIGNTVLTMADWAKRLDPNGKIATIVEMLSQTNDILQDLVMKEGNLPTGEQTTIRTGLPNVYFRMINQGIPKSKSTTVQVTEHCAILEGRSEVDKDEAELNGNVKAYRLSEVSSFLESMNQKMASTLFYGNSSVSPEQFTGLSARYSDATNAANKVNIISGGGSSTDNTSLWLVVWSTKTACGIFPKGSKVGLVHEDLGLQDVYDSNGNKYRAYVDWFQWKLGLVVKDWRYIVRVANIDVSDLVGMTGTQATSASTFLPKLMARAIDRIPNINAGKAAFYCNRTVASNLRILAMEKSVNVLSIEEGLNQFGQKITGMKFAGIPIRICDQIVNNESAVS